MSIDSCVKNFHLFSQNLYFNVTLRLQGSLLLSRSTVTSTTNKNLSQSDNTLPCLVYIAPDQRLRWATIRSSLLLMISTSPLRSYHLMIQYFMMRIMTHFIPLNA